MIKVLGGIAEDSAESKMSFTSRGIFPTMENNIKKIFFAIFRIVIQLNCIAYFASFRAKIDLKIADNIARGLEYTVVYSKFLLNYSFVINSHLCSLFFLITSGK